MRMEDPMAEWAVSFRPEATCNMLSPGRWYPADASLASPDTPHPHNGLAPARPPPRRDGRRGGCGLCFALGFMHVAS